MVMNVGRHCSEVHKISYNELSRESKDKCPLCDKYVKFLVKHLKGAKHKDEARAKELVMSLDKRRRDNTAKSPEPKGTIFSWTVCLQKFSSYLQSVDGGGKREVDAEKQKSILQRIVSICDFEDLKAFTLDTYQKKHVKFLEESKCKPSTFISHNCALVAFIKFLTMRHAAECSFQFQPTMIRIKQWNEFYRRRLQERRHEIRESDRRNAIRTEDVNKVLHSRHVMRCIQDMQLMVEHPGLSRMRVYGEVFFTVLAFENTQRPSAVRGIIINEAKADE
ncbi:unnamed protein product [Clavelina lepadiformis]|uniref:C2H2-type domain-containing protein n=1 Tax=Clavelina lepadiformis TaxID=159417 RepID=A0ABP0FV36_CLALP